jgi:hypothetical protein
MVEKLNKLRENLLGNGKNMVHENIGLFTKNKKHPPGTNVGENFFGVAPLCLRRRNLVYPP